MESGSQPMSIELDQETQRLIEHEIQAGGFHDAAAFVGAAVRHFLIARERPGVCKRNGKTYSAADEHR
jgi:Arc/MetJ-type ribon-helix-helix transcriptional regulator